MAIPEKMANGDYPAYAWPGGYPIFYLCSDGGILCPECMNAERELIETSIRERANDGWQVVAADINWEDAMLLCDHCSARIESAYAEEKNA